MRTALIVLATGIAGIWAGLYIPRSGPVGNGAGLLSVNNATGEELFFGCKKHLKSAYIIGPNQNLVIKVSCSNENAKESVEVFN